MDPFRPSAPWGSPAWLRMDADDYFAQRDRAGRPIRPEFFAMVRRFRRARIRLIVEVSLLLVAVVLVVIVPNLGEIILATVLGIVALYDVLLVLHLHRRIDEAWRDLAVAPPE